MTRCCPLHGDPGRPGYEWPCPIAVEGDPDGAETCPHFLAEMQRRVAEVEKGHFWRLERDQDAIVMHEFRHHQPTGVSRRFPRTSQDDADARERALGELRAHTGGPRGGEERARAARLFDDVMTGLRFGEDAELPPPADVDAPIVRARDEADGRGPQP